MNSTISEMMLHRLNTLGNNSALDRVGGSGGVGGTDMSVLERQRAVLKLQQEKLVHALLQQPPQLQPPPVPPQSLQQQQNFYLPQLNIFASPIERGLQGFVINGCSGENGHLNNMDPAGMGNNYGGWADYGGGDFSTPRSGITTTESSGLESAAGVAVNGAANYANSRTTPAVGAAGKDMTAAEKLNSFKKRKAGKAMIIAAKGAEDDGDNNNDDDNRGSNKKIKAFSQDEESNKINTAQNNKNKCSKSSGSNQSNNGNNKKYKLDKEASGCTSKAENSKADYIHVRARRGQATDSHSLAERVRREKISERMKYLQELVPGCSKITGKAGMLDEIINYVQSLQRQVEFLSMKLAAVNPSLDSDVDDFITKEILPVSCSANMATMGIGPEIVKNQAAAYLEYNLHQIQQMGPLLYGSDMGVNSTDMGLLRRTIGAPPVSAPETFLDASCFTQQIQNCLPWDPDHLQDLFFMELQPSGSGNGSGRPTSLFPSQTFTGLTDPNNNIKMEM